ncbi:MAG: four helix bundle protein [Prevotellaceae bacterium]|jgi:four helix bundle protein|nr:four helix bundle protein [Prevotellaceae bacterium]
MSSIKRFEDLEIWQKARALCKDIFCVTRYEAFSKDYRLRDQIKAASGSVMDNVAEGFERSGNKELIQFLYIAKGSCGETRSQLHRALDYEYISVEEFEILKSKTEELSRDIANFIKYLQQVEMKGSKYR